MAIATKICGLKTRDGIAAAMAGGAAFAGFAFYPPSPRAVTAEAAAALRGDLAPGVKAVGLFVDPDDALLTAVLARVALDIVQLHGKETPGRVREIGERFGVETMKAIGIAGAEEVAAARAYEGAADYLLFDASPKATGAAQPLPGGNAAPFDWALLKGLRWSAPWFLAGGLTVQNVGRAIALTGARMVDVSSGVERTRGVKDPDLIRAFLTAVRAADSNVAER